MERLKDGFEIKKFGYLKFVEINLALFFVILISFFSFHPFITSFPCGSLTFSPPFVSSVFSSSQIFPLLPHESSSSIFLAGYSIPPSPFDQPSTLVADQLHGRSYRTAITRKWNVLSRAVIHLFHLASSCTPHRGRRGDRHLRIYRRKIFSTLTRYIRGIFTLAATRRHKSRLFFGIISIHDLHNDIIVLH